MRTNFYFTIIALLLLSINQLQGQDASPKFNKNIFVEFFGNGVLFSLNYDMRLYKGVRDGFGVRGGIGGGSIHSSTLNGRTDLSMVTVPVGINYLVGKRRSSFEAGLGFTTIYVNANSIEINDEFYSGYGWGLVGFLNAGYRFQPLRNGAMFRVDWTPAFGKGGFEAAFFGLSLGIGFK